MSVSALTNSFYNYVPVTSSQNEISSTNNISNSHNQENIKAVDEKSTQNQTISDTYKENNKNTSSNNSNSNENSSSYLTGEEILASRPEKNTSNSNNQLTEEDQKQIDELKSRDREVKTHEQAHIAAGGSYVLGGASYDYQTGPDGKQYAVGGSVNIDTAPIEGNPEATIAKAQVVIKAALAPAEPSGQDQKVASQARQMMSEARKELTSQKNTETNKETEKNIVSSVNENSEENDDNSKITENTNISLKENTDKTDNGTENKADTTTTAYQAQAQNTKASSYNIGSLISLTA